jgi:filamentous hemagglutinin family protein
MKRKMWWLKRSSSPHLCARYLMLFCTVGFILLPTSYVWANPAGEAVVGGAATFQREGNTLTVNQATDRLAVNWESFNIAAGERTHFNMPSSTSAALNRVIGGNPSSIYGSLSANGILYLINPSGILVGPGGTVNAAAFMASTLDVSTEQFMNAKNGGAMNFAGSSGESIINQGNITAEKGDVFLVAQKVENRGTINAANGTVGMVGSGQNTDVMVHEVGGKGFAIRVAQLQGEAATGSNRDLPDGEELLNEGSINAAQAELNASGNVYALAIRNSGTIRAKAVVANADGTVRLDGGLGDVINTGRMYAKNSGDDATAAGGKIDIAGQNITASPESIITAAGGEQGGNGGSVKIDSQDTTIVQGKVDVAAPAAGAKGGKVELLGERVGLFDGAKVDASGGAGGGTVLVGGDYLGGQTPKPELKDLAKQEAEPVKNAKATVMADTAEIKADATVSGDGGKIILWSDEYTGFSGQLFARGGIEGGNGGFIETSSKDNLQAFGNGNASASQGAGGLWLLDPANVVITAATAANMTAAPNFSPTANNGQVSAAVINTQLENGTSVIVTTAGAGTQSGDIIVEAAIAPAAESAVGASLTLTADRNIIVAQPITLRGGNISMSAGNTTATGILAVNAALSTTGGIGIAGGNVSLNTGAGGSIELGANITTVSTAVANSGSINFNARPVLLTANVTLDAGQEIGGSVNFGSTTSSLNSPFTMTINTQSGDITFGGPVGAGNVAGALPLAGLTINTGSGTTTLNGNLFTSGGPVVFGTTVALATGNITVDTTRLGNSNGGDISFNQTLTTSTARSLTLLSGEVGQLTFGGNVSNLSGLTISSAAAVNVDNGSSFTIAGPISITPILTTAGNSLTMTTSSGGITLAAGADLSASSNSSNGGNLTLTSAGAISVNGAILSNGGVAVAAPGVTPSGPGSNGGAIFLTGTIISVESVSLTGGNGIGIGRGGNGGSVSLTASAGNATLGAVDISGGTGAGGGNGGRAGTLALSATGTRILNGSILASGGNGNGAGQGGVASTLTLGAVQIGAPNVAFIAVGGNNGTGTGRGADGNLFFSGAVNGAVAGANSLEIDVAAGTVTFQGAVGGTRLGQVTIQNAKDVSFGSTFAADKFVQNASVPVGGIYTIANQDGTTTFAGAVTLSGTGTVLDLTGYNFTFGAGVGATAGSINGVINGVFAVNTAGLTLGGDMTLEAGAVPNINPQVDLNFAGTAVSTTSGALTFGTVANPLNVRLLANTTLSTGSSGGQIFFGGLLDSDATSRNLTLNSGGAVTMNGLVGSLNPLADLTTDAGGSLVLAAVGSRATPSINATGTLTFNDQVDLQSDTVLQADALTLAATGLIDGANDLLVLLSTGALTFNGQVGRDTSLTSLRVEGGSGVTFNFVGTQANLSVATTGNQYYQTAVTLGQNTILNAGSMDFLSTVNGGSSLLLDSAGAINLYGLVGNTGTALTQFQTSGGGILNLLATGASGANPTIKTTGAQLFGSSLVLGEDTFLTSTTSGDFIFLNAIDSRQANQPRNFTVQGAERVVLESAAGGAVRLGGVSLTAGTDVTVLGGIDTFGALIEITAGNGVTSGSVVLSGDITTAVADQLGGAINLNADEEVIFNGGTVNTFGGNISVTGPAFIQAATTITTAGGDVNDGTIDFGGILNGDSILALNAGTALVTFTGAVGGNQPLDLNIQGAGGVSFNQAVLIGSGATVINSLAGNVSFASTLNKLGGTFTMDLGTRTATFTGAVGGTRPFDMNITSAGGVTFDSAVTLGSGASSITSQSGGVNFTTLDKLAGTLSLVLGNQIANFTGAVGGTNPFALTVSSAGGLTFGGAVRMGGAFNLNVDGPAPEISFTTLDGDQNLTILSDNANITFTGAVGGIVPVNNLQLSLGGNGTTTFGGNITSSGGLIRVGNRMVIDGDVTIDTTALNSIGGTFASDRTLDATDTLADDLVLVMGGGGVAFGGAVGGTIRPRSITIESATSGVTSPQDSRISIGAGAGGFLANANLVPLFQGLPLNIDSFGDITINGYVSTSGENSGNQFANREGGNLTLRANGNINVTGAVNASGAINNTAVDVPNGDGATTRITLGGPGHAGGTISITSSGGDISIGSIIGNGGDAGGPLGGVGGGGSQVFLTATGGEMTIGSISINGGDGLGEGNGAQAGALTASAQGAIDLRLIVANGGQAGTDGAVGGTGGTISVTRTSSSGNFLIGSVAVLGGDGTGSGSFGGLGGSVRLIAELGDFQVPTVFLTAGGNGDVDDQNGQGGLVTLQATDGNISFQNQTLNLKGDGSITIVAGRNLVFATNADFTTPSNSSGGVVITSNEDSPRTDRRGVVTLEYGSANTAGELYMPSSAYLISNGGKVAVDVKNTAGLAGAMTLSGITTSAADLNAGSIQINQDVGSVLGNVTILGSIDANGGEPASTGPLYGRNGGSVLVSGLAVSLQQINTSGSASLATATVPAFGGSGGDVTITGTSILIRAGTVPATGSFAINTSGGTGQGTGNANGGSGGNIRLIGDVTLNSPDASRTTIILNTQGGVFAAGGVSGTGGNITVTGTLTGTETTSNTLDLRYGSGTVTLGDAAADTITLGTLITAADDARSTGNLIINGELDLGTLTTYARGYSIEINGGGTIANTVTFNNTGNVALGSLTADTTFSNGVDSTAPATSLLKGNIISGTSANPGQGTPLSFGAATLVGNTTLDSNGSNVSLGTIDGPFNLDFASGIGSGVVDITSAVGASSRVGTITVSPGISQPVLFRSSVTAAGLVGAADTTISFDGNVNLTGRANLLGLTKLNNTLYADQNTTFSFTSGANSTLNDVELALGPILINGLGNYSFTGLFNGAQNLTLSGVGSKVFSGTVGGTTAIGTGTGAAISMSGGDVTFGTLTTASGLASTTANVIFNGIATLGAGDTGTTLDSDVTLSGATISSAGSVALGNDVGIDTITLDTGTVTLTGAGAYTVNVQMTGDQRLVLGGAGTKTFVSTADVTGFTQDALSGTVTFQDNVSTSGVSLFSASTVLDNINFTSSGVGALGATAMNGVTLNGVVTLQGVGNYVFNGAMTGTALLALASEGTSTFESTVTVNRVDQLVSAGTATFRGDVTTGGVSSFAGATVLDGMVFSAGGVTTMNGVELSTGAVTLQGAGAYSIAGAVTGSQNMILAGSGAKIFNGTVSVGSALLGITQANVAGNTVRFNNTVTTAGVSTFNRGVTLGAMTFNSGGATTMNDAVTLAGAATLQGAGSYTVNGAVGGGQNLTLAEAGTKAFNSTLNLGTFSQTGGKVSLGGGVTTSGAVNLATVGTTGDILVNSTGATQTYGSVTLAGDLTTATTSGDVDAVTFGPGGVTGAGNLNVQAASLALNGVVANKGLFSAETSGNIDLGGGYLSAIEVARIASTGGARFASLVGDVTAQNLATSTSLSMQALDGETTVNGVSVNGSLNMESGGAVNFNGNDTYASSLAFTGQSVSSDGSPGVLANIIVPSLGGISLTGSGNGLSYSPSGNLNVSARISVNGGDITLDPSGNFVNSYAGNPFSANSTKILTKDLFSSWPSNGAVPGLQVVYGVNSLGQLGANQIGVSTTLLAGNAGPFVLEFTTGTGQPYILAQQTAIPPVMLPTALTGGSGFAGSVTYSADEIEMMTPEERSAYENQQRQVSARVILQGQSGEGEEIGAPTEGRAPQAANPPIKLPSTPTAQVFMEGKPLAGAKMDRERGDASRIIKIRPTRAVALRPSYQTADVMESERMAAEVSVGAAPVAQSRSF